MRFILSHRVGYVALSISALWAAFAAWLSMGAIGFASANGTRLGLLPGSPAALVVAFVAAAAVIAFLRAGAPFSPLALLTLVMLPWLPLRFPAAFLIWSGPVAAGVWITVGVLLTVSSDLGSWIAKIRLNDRGRTPLLAGVIALLVFSAAAWRAAPSVLIGDEPHYLVITQSLLYDHDLKIQNNHRRGDYRVYYEGNLPPHFQRLGRNGEIYSIHAPGLPTLVLPAFALGGYRAVQAFLLLVSAVGAGLAWWVTWLATRRSDAAWLGWAAVTLCVTGVFHSFTVYPDGTGGVLTLTGAWALLRANENRNDERVRPWFWHGVALSILPWLHSRFAVIACGFGALILLRLPATRNAAAKAVVFLVVPALSAMLWLGYFIALYGRPDPSAPYGPGEIGSFAFVPEGLGGLLFDQRFGLLPYAPVLAFALAGLALMIVRPESRRVGLELMFVMASYLVTVTHFAMWWGGSSPPARFFVPVLPLLAIPAGIFWVAVARRPERVLVLASLVFTVLTTITLVAIDRGRLAFNVRDTPALWLEWLSKGADLPQALPGWSRGADMPFFRDVAIWMGAVLATLFGAWVFGRNLRRTAWHVATAWALAVALMAAASIVWAVHGTDGRNVASGQLQLLRRITSTPRGIALDVDHLRTIDLASVPRRLRIELSRRPAPGRAAVRDDSPLFEGPRMPAGEYLLTPTASAGRGWLMLGIGRNQFALRTTPLSSPPQPIHLRFPISVRGIVVRGDEEARQTISGLVVQPLNVRPPGEWGPATAQAAVKYEHASVFFLDERSFPEPEAFWIRGSRSSSVVVQPDDGRSSMTMLIRNGPVNNEVDLDVAGQRTNLPLAPAEERRLAIPIDVSRGAAFVTVRSSGGFRPSEVDPGSRDNRLLGVWIRIEP